MEEINSDILYQIKNLQNDNSNIKDNIESILSEIDLIKNKNKELENRIYGLESSGTNTEELEERIEELENNFTGEQANSSLDSDKLGGKDPNYYASTEQLNSVVNGLVWKNPVNNIEDLKAIDNPQEGWTVSVSDSNKIYRFDTETIIGFDLEDETKIKPNDGTIGSWILLGTVIYNKATKEQDGLMSKEDKEIIDNLESTYLKLSGGEMTGDIIANNIYSNNNVLVFNSVADMKASNKVKAGYTLRTLGFYEPNDGGGADYVITNDIGEDEADEASIIALQKGLYAKVILDNNRTINLKWFGVKGDNESDDTEAIQKAVFYCRDYVIKNKCGNVILFIPSGIYKITNTVRIPMHFMHIKGSKQTPIFKMEEKANIPVIWFATTPDEVTKATEIGHTVKNLTVRSTSLNINSHVENSIGVKFGGATMEDEKAMQIRFENFSILGFETAQLWLCNVYLLDFNSCGCGYQRYYIRCPINSNNSGEKMSFRNSTLWFVKTFFYISQPNIQLMCHNCSFDGGYQVLLSDVINEAPGNTRYFYQCHFEPIAGGSDDYLIHIKNPTVLENVVLDGCTGYIPHIKTDYLIKTNTGGGNTSWKGTNIVIKNSSMILGDATPPSSGYLCDHYVRSENFVFSNQNNTVKKCLLSEYNNAFGNNKFSYSNIVENNTDNITNSRAIFLLIYGKVIGKLI